MTYLMSTFSELIGARHLKERSRLRKDDNLASPHFESYRKKFPAREPSLIRMQNTDELQDFSSQPDVFQATESPADSWTRGEPPAQTASNGTNKNLWLVLTDDVLYALEEGESGRSLKRGRLSHTNLSGGADAFCGGELWFRDEASVWINGGSSRYQPRSAEELQEVVAAFRQAGYKVASCGWSEERNEPQRYFREVPQWE